MSASWTSATLAATAASDRKRQHAGLERRLRRGLLIGLDQTQRSRLAVDSRGHQRAAHERQRHIHRLFDKFFQRQPSLNKQIVGLIQIRVIHHVA